MIEIKQNVMRIEEAEEMMRHVLDEQTEKGLRDYFAAQAMQGIMTDAAYGVDDGPDVARIAYAMADAMIKEREK